MQLIGQRSALVQPLKLELASLDASKNSLSHTCGQPIMASG